MFSSVSGSVKNEYDNKPQYTSHTIVGNQSLDTLEGNPKSVNNPYFSDMITSLQRSSKEKARISAKSMKRLSQTRASNRLHR